MNKTLRLLALTFILISSLHVSAQSNFIGTNGIYVLGRLSIPMAASEYNKPFVAGTAVRVKWDSVETSPGIFNWTFIDAEIANAYNFGKKISLLIVGYPNWISSIGAPMYDYIDNNPISSTYLDTMQAPITWSNQYVSRISSFIQQLGMKYANDTNVTYVNCGAGNMNNNLPNHTANGTDFWTATGYNPDTLIEKMKQILDVYMNAFPNTPAWNSLENIWFEPQATGNPYNYVITQFANYGVAAYSDRFGAWREDLTGCQNTTSTNSQWFTVASYPCKTGGQMTYNVQDGPARMNQCGLSPNTKEFVLESAFNKGFSMNMRYFEVYKEDIDDTSLAVAIQKASDSTQAIYTLCNPALGIDQDLINDEVKISPNPFLHEIMVTIRKQNIMHCSLTIQNLFAQTVLTMQGNVSANTFSKSIDLSKFSKGIYLLSITIDGERTTRKIIKQ